jgi:hypothetical protein
MRYNPTTDQARNIDEIAAECKSAIQGPTPRATGKSDFELLHLYTRGLKNHHPRHFYAWLQAQTAMHVAEAMGNFSEYRRLRASIIAGLY